MVHVFVEGTAAECIALEETIASRWGLEFCAVAPTVEDAPLPLATLAAAGGHWLHRVLEAGRAPLIGIGHGRTLAAVVGNLPRIARAGVRFVSLLGSLTRHAAANPFDVIHRLTEITGAESYFMPAPFFADSVEDKTRAARRSAASRRCSRWRARPSWSWSASARSDRARIC